MNNRRNIAPARSSDIRYFIGEHDGIEYPFDRNTYRAYFYWREDNVPRARSFSIEQLKTHIEECALRREPTQKFERALARLRQVNGDGKSNRRGAGRLSVSADDQSKETPESGAELKTDVY